MPRSRFGKKFHTRKASYPLRSKSCAGVPPVPAKTYTFTMKNPSEPSQTPGFTYPTNSSGTSSPQDFFLCIANEWGPDNLFVQASGGTGAAPFAGPTALTTPTSTTVHLDGFTVPPWQSGYWEMNTGMIVAESPVDSGAAAYGLPQQHSGIGVGLPSVTSFSFSHNMAMYGSNFWALTREYGKMQPLTVEVMCVPKHNKPQNWQTIVDNSFDPGTSSLQGTSSLPTAMDSEGIFGGVQHMQRAALTGFKTRTWEVKVPRIFLRARTNVDSIGVLVGLWYENWYRWNVFGQTDIKQFIRPDDLLRRCPQARMTKLTFSAKKRFLQGQNQVFPDYDNQDTIASTTGPFPYVSTTSLGLGFSGKPVQPIDIPANGYRPGYWTPSSSQAGCESFFNPMNVSVGDFVIDTSEWNGLYFMRSTDAVPSALPLHQFPQDFTSLDTYGPNGAASSSFAAYAPQQMCPPMEWDVYYRCKWRFSGKPNSASANRLAQS